MINKEIIFVASWNISIPPKWYWAVEDIIWNYKIFLEEKWYDIQIVNTKNIFKLIKKTVFVKNKIIHFHYEPYLIISYLLNKVFFRKNKILWTSHNWSIASWRETFFYHIIARIISNFSDSSMFSLSKILENYFLEKGYKWKRSIIQNGINTSEFLKNINPVKDIVYLWVIDGRKWQGLYLEYFNLNIKTDFVWPYLDKSIDLKSHNYLWIWTKDEVFKKLWEYKVLVLLTKSEWDPLVIKEALSAWCSILTSKIWWINIEENNFIKIIDLNNKKDLKNLNKYILKLLNNNNKHREKILKNSKSFDWANIIEDYMKELNNL